MSTGKLKAWSPQGGAGEQCQWATQSLWKVLFLDEDDNTPQKEQLRKARASALLGSVASSQSFIYKLKLSMLSHYRLPWDSFS